MKQPHSGRQQAQMQALASTWTTLNHLLSLSTLWDGAISIAKKI
jgi:hypothetical protein